NGVLYVTFVTSSNTAVSLLAIDEATGALKWQVDSNIGFAFSTFSTVAVARGNGYWDAAVGFPRLANDAAAGSRGWAFGCTPASSPVVAGGYVFEGSFAFDFFSGFMTALDVNTGQVVWQYRMQAGAVGTSAAYNNGTVFLSTWDGNLWSWDAATGAVLQTLQLSSRGSTSSVALGDGYAVVGDQDGEMNGFSFVGAGVAARVVVNPASTDVAVGRAALFQAAAYDLYDNQVGGQTFVWSSQADLGSVLPLTPSGEKIVYIAGIQSGTDSLQAMNAGGLSNASTVNILPGPLDHVDVTPAAASIVAGTTMSFNADAKDRYGN